MNAPSPRSWWWSLVALAAWGCGASTTAVESPEASGGVTVLVQPVLEQQAQAARDARPDLRVVVVEPQDDGKVREAREHLAAAWESYVAMEFEAGLETIREAVVLLESSARTQEDFDALAEAILVRGMAELALGREDQGRQSLLAAARLRPERELDEGRYPPPVRELYEELRGDLRAEPASSLTVATRPPGARLYLDGEPHGTAPQTLYATSGRHQLRVQRSGYAPRTLAVTFSPEGGQMEVDLPVADPVAAGRQVLESEEQAGDDTRAAWRTAFGTDAVVLAVPAAQGLSGTWVHLPSGETASASAAELPELIDRLEEQAPSPQGAAEGTARHNEGLFARALLGILLRTDDLGQDVDEEITVQGGSLAADIEVSVGGSLAPGVVLGGMLSGAVGGPTYAIEDDLDDAEPRVGGIGSLGVFIAWYPTARGGWHLYGSVGAASGELQAGGSDKVDDATLGGVSLALGGGYEWWIAGEWGLGALVRLVGYRLTDGKGTNLSVGALSIASTITFN